MKIVTRIHTALLSPWKTFILIVQNYTNRYITLIIWVLCDHAILLCKYSLISYITHWPFHCSLFYWSPFSIVFPGTFKNFHLLSHTTAENLIISNSNNLGKRSLFGLILTWKSEEVYSLFSEWLCECGHLGFAEYKF